VHFGGPDQPARALRDLLLARIQAAPPGSQINWATYYFRDRGLAEAMVAAHRRGVTVRLILERDPRRDGANRAVAERLGEGLQGGLRLHDAPLPIGELHTKIYAFSAPVPTAFIGSFNPSGDDPEDPDVAADIGDQDRGHNLLVEFRAPQVVAAATDQVLRLWRSRGLSRFSAGQNEAHALGATTLYFYPRLKSKVVEPTLDDLGQGDRVSAAISHMGMGPLAKRLARAARRGAEVRVVVHDTRRRVSERVLARLSRAGVEARRYCHPDGLPMHA
jgi:hypothetical protein